MPRQCSLSQIRIHHRLGTRTGKAPLSCATIAPMRICLSMIVKNEAPVIERCLRSVKPYVHAWAVSDTGSTDGTQDIIRKFMADLPGELIERPWVDFSANRND